MRRQWRLIDSGYGDAYSNMAMDEALLLACIKGESPPTLRFYGWKPAAVSVGYTQDVAAGVNVAACSQRGLSLVRRPTGGRAVLHQQELTYSLIVPQVYFSGRGVRESYRIIAEGLISGLGNLGIEAGLANPRTHPEARGRNRSAACFLASSWYEIAVAGRKLIGSAQRRVNSHILQQGSIPLVVDYSAIAELFPNGNMSKIELVRQAQMKIASVGELVDRRFGLEELKQKLKQGISQAMGIEFIKGETSPAERGLAQKLYKQKYSTKSWNFKRGEGK